MLNREERYQVLRFLRHCCNFGLLPAQVELSSWDLISHRNRIKIWKCRIWFFLLVLHAVYKLSSLASACFLTKGTPLHELIIHAVSAIAGSVYLSWYYLLYVKYPGVFSTYVRMTLTGKIGDVLAVDDPKKTAWIRRIKQWTLQDFFAMCLPYTMAMGFAVYYLAAMYHPSMSFLLYAGIPSQYQSWIIFGVLFLEEMRYGLVIMAVALPAWILQIISIDLVNSRLQQLIQSIPKNAATRNFRRTYKSLRHVQLYISNVNLINSFVIFTWKILCIGICIGTGYAAIAHFSEYPLFGLLYYNIVLNSAFLYIAGYGRAFRIPALMEKVRLTALLRVRYPKCRSSKIFKLQMRSVPRVGIKVGEFHTIERASTLNFIDFVLTNIVNMLVANRTG